MKELTRDEFREGTYKRDGYKCVICGEPAIYDEKGNVTNLDAHHIIERRLFKPHGHGYFLDNGATLCEKHHIEAETTILDCEDIREACGISKVIIPEHFYSDINYDKWGFKQLNKIYN